MKKERMINFGTYSLYSTLKSLGLIILLLFVLKRCHKERSDKREQIFLNVAVNDSIKFYKNKAGEEIAKRQVMETKDSKTFLALKSQDLLIIELQSDVRRNRKLLKKQGSSSIIKTETKIDTTTNTVVTKDSITASSIYTSSIDNKWYYIKSIASQDSTSYNLKTYNKLSLTIGREKQGFLGLGKSKPYAIANDENPYSSIKDMRTYQVTIPDKRFGISAYVGYGGTIYEQKVIVGPQFGVGGTYTFIKF